MNSETKTVSTEIFIRIKALREALDTHQKLTDPDKKYFLDLTQNLLKTQNINLDKYTLFILYTNQETNIGRFCLSYNDFSDLSIKKKDDKFLINLITDFKENVFFEFYDNKLLDEIEKNSIKQILETELAITKIVLQKAIQTENISSNLLTDEFQKEYSSSLGYKYTGIPKVIYLAQSNEIQKVHIFDYMNLIKNLAVENKINKSIDLNERKIKSLSDKYEKEIKMYKRYRS